MLYQLSIGQSRKEWRGQVTIDAQNPENIIIFNTNSKSGAVTDADGFFKIKATEGDTLAFSGLAIKSKKVLLTNKDAEAAFIVVRLESFINELESVDVSKSNIRNPVGEKGSQTIVDKKYFDDHQSSPKNPFIYDGSMENGVNFVRLYKDIVKLVRKNRSKKADVAPKVDFSELAINKFDYDFFTRKLHIREDQIKLFLVFCENDPKAGTFTDKTTKFELMDFLINKNTEFKRIITSGK